MTGDELGDFGDDGVSILRVEAAVVEDRVRAVIAGVGTADARSVGQFALAGDASVRFEIYEIVGGRGKRGERRGWAVGIGTDVTVAFEPAAWNEVEGLAGLQALENLNECLFSLVAHDDIDEIFAQRLGRQ